MTDDSIISHCPKCGGPIYTDHGGAVDPAPYGADNCHALWGAVFERAVRDAGTNIPTQPNGYNRGLYLKGRREIGAKIMPRRKWATDRRFKIKRLELRRDEALAWIESECLNLCCELVDVDAGMMRRRMQGEVAA